MILPRTTCHWVEKGHLRQTKSLCETVHHPIKETSLVLEAAPWTNCQDLVSEQHNQPIVGWRGMLNWRKPWGVGVSERELGGGNSGNKQMRWLGSRVGLAGLKGFLEGRIHWAVYVMEIE